MAKKINFIKETLATLPVPLKGKRLRVYDSKTRGLLIDVTSNGIRTFYWCRKVNRRVDWERIGPFPDLSIEEARNKAAEFNSRIAKGEDLQAIRQSFKNELTLGELHKLYIENYAKDECATWKKMKQSFHLWFGDLENTRLSIIRKSDIQSRINELRKVTDKDIQAVKDKLSKALSNPKLSKNKRVDIKAKLQLKISELEQDKKDDKDKHPNRANRAHNDIRALFQWAIDKDYFSGPNICLGIDRASVQSRKRFIQPDEFNRLFQAIAGEPNADIRDYIWLSLWTAARKSNVLAARWECISFELGTWYIPITKNGDSQTVPLSDTAKRLLKERYDNRTSDEWVFPSTASASGHLVEPKSGWKRILECAGLTNLRLHDLRRTMGSYLAIVGVNSPTIQSALGHKTLAAAAIYQRVNSDPVRQAVEKATATMLHHAEQHNEQDNIKEFVPAVKQRKNA